MSASNDYLVEDICSNGLYRIFKNGKIKTRITTSGYVGRWREAGIFNGGNGYIRIKYKRKHLLVHRVVFRKYNGLISADLTINHKNGNKSDNRYANLELITNRENIAHSYAVLKRAPSKGNRKINQATANQIRLDYFNGYRCVDLATKYKLSKSTISYIINSKTWK